MLIYFLYYVTCVCTYATTAEENVTGNCLFTTGLVDAISLG
jgi:hypothetical protein